MKLEGNSLLTALRDVSKSIMFRISQVYPMSQCFRRLLVTLRKLTIMLSIAAGDAGKEVSLWMYIMTHLECVPSFKTPTTPFPPRPIHLPTRPTATGVLVVVVVVTAKLHCMRSLSALP